MASRWTQKRAEIYSLSASTASSAGSSWSTARLRPLCRGLRQIRTEAIATGDREHPDDDALNRHILSAGAKFIGVGWRLVKQKGKNMPIDPCVALAMALRVLVEVGETTSTEPPRATVNRGGFALGG